MARNVFVLFICLNLTHFALAKTQELENRPPGDSIPAMPAEPHKPNTDKAYKALRNVASGETFQVKDLLLKRDAASSA